MGESLHKGASKYRKEPVNIAGILSQPIWNNHFLQKQDSTLFYAELYSRGVSCIRNIVDEQGKFLTWYLAKESKDCKINISYLG